MVLLRDPDPIVHSRPRERAGLNVQILTLINRFEDEIQMGFLKFTLDYEKKLLSKEKIPQEARMTLKESAICPMVDPKARPMAFMMIWMKPQIRFQI